MKYSQAVTVLKRRLANQIINNAVDLGSYNEVTLDDLFNFTHDLEKERSKNKRRDPKSMAERFNQLPKEQQERLIWDQNLIAQYG